MQINRGSLGSTAGGNELKQTPASPERPKRVLLVTGYASIELARQALARRSPDSPARPFQPEDLRMIDDG